MLKDVDAQAVAIMVWERISTAGIENYSRNMLAKVFDEEFIKYWQKRNAKAVA